MADSSFIFVAVFVILLLSSTSTLATDAVGHELLRYNGTAGDTLTAIGGKSTGLWDWAIPEFRTAISNDGSLAAVSAYGGKFDCGSVSLYKNTKGKKNANALASYILKAKLDVGDANANCPKRSRGLSLPFAMSATGDTFAIADVARFDCITIFTKTKNNEWFQSRQRVCSTSVTINNVTVYSQSLSVSANGRVIASHLTYWNGTVLDIIIKRLFLYSKDEDDRWRDCTNAEVANATTFSYKEPIQYIEVNSVALSDNGSVIVVQTGIDNRLQIFKRSEETGFWVIRTDAMVPMYDVQNYRNYLMFSSDLSLSADGQNIAVLTINWGSGYYDLTMQVYDTRSQKWTKIKTLWNIHARKLAMSSDGRFVCVSFLQFTKDRTSNADWVTPFLKCFAKVQSGGWREHSATKLGIFDVDLGSPSLSGDGSTFVYIGSVGADELPGAHILRRSSHRFSPYSQPLVPQEQNIQFGSSVALSGNGKVAVVSAPFDRFVAGAVFVFKRDAGGAWIQQKLTIDVTPRPRQLVLTIRCRFGAEIAIDFHGEWIAASARDCYQIAIFKYNANTGQWNHHDSFHTSVSTGPLAFSAAGDILLDGGMTVYRRFGHSWQLFQEWIENVMGTGAISGDGSTIAIIEMDVTYRVMRSLSNGTFMPEAKFPVSLEIGGFYSQAVSLSSDGSLMFGTLMDYPPTFCRLTAYGRNSSGWFPIPVVQDGAHRWFLTITTTVYGEHNDTLVVVSDYNYGYTTFRRTAPNGPWMQENGTIIIDGLNACTNSTYENCFTFPSKFLALSADGRALLLGNPNYGWNTGAAIYVERVP